jgi:hypothetical protein
MVSIPLDASLFVIVSKQISLRKSLTRVELEPEEKGGNVGGSWREERLLCWTTESMY